jgi:hypothetical protein
MMEAEVRERLAVNKQISQFPYGDVQFQEVKRCSG